MANAPMQTAATLTYSDRPDVPETFADSVERIIFDQTTLRIEFVVNRFDTAAPGAQPTGKKLTACRLVMPISGIISLSDQVGQVMRSLQQQGMVVSLPQTPGSVN